MLICISFYKQAFFNKFCKYYIMLCISIHNFLYLLKTNILSIFVLMKIKANLNVFSWFLLNYFQLSILATIIPTYLHKIIKCPYFIIRNRQLFNFLFHQVMEVRMTFVHWAVDSNCSMWPFNLVQDSCHSWK